MFNIPLLPLIGDPLFDDTPLSKKTLPRAFLFDFWPREGFLKQSNILKKNFK